MSKKVNECTSLTEIKKNNINDIQKSKNDEE
jgi:hypothetical protein